MGVSTHYSFTIGQWVRGEKFYGREALIRELLEGPRLAVWVAGLRRIGKTSLLREIERRINDAPDSSRMALFWDLQGASDDTSLRETLLAGIDELETIARLEPVWETLSTPQLLRQLVKLAKGAGKTLLLLCDEAEALLAVARSEPQLLARLRSVMQSGVRCVLTATPRLTQLHSLDGADTSPFLHGFEPPIYLGPMAAAEITPLLQQAGFPDDEQQMIYTLSGGHPYLLQLLAKHTTESGDVQQAYDSMLHDETIHNFFRVDYESLRPIEQSQLNRCARGALQAATASTTTAEKIAQQTLQQLGLLMASENHLQLRTPFMREWLLARNEPPAAVTASTATGSRPPRTHLLTGDRVGAYEIMHEIGRGGMGVVYCARDVNLGRLTAIKLLPPDLLDDESSKARLRQEARAISILQHPNIAMIYTVEYWNEAPCLCMEYIDGERLDIWSQAPPKSIDQRIAIARQIVSALAAAHNAGLVHRDLKPGNILVRNDGVPKLLDFGIARRLGSATASTQTGNTPGTLVYMSPEQVSHIEVDTRSDIFSLGVVFYELFTGRRPFEGDNELALAYSIVNEKPEPPVEIAPEIFPDLEQMLLQMLEKDPAKRFKNGDELLHKFPSSTRLR